MCNDDYNYDSTAQMCIEISRLEYEYSFKRAEKFNNKVYILLTVCGFIFVMFTNALSNMREIDVFHPFKCGWILLYDILLVYSILGMTVLIHKLVSSLSGLSLKHYDSNLILELDMMSKSALSVARFVIMQYEKARDYNNRKIDEKYKSLDESVKLLLILSAVLIFITIAGNFAASPQVKI